MEMLQSRGQAGASKHIGFAIGRNMGWPREIEHCTHKDTKTSQMKLGRHFSIEVGSTVPPSHLTYFAVGADRVYDSGSTASPAFAVERSAWFGFRIW